MHVGRTARRPSALAYTALCNGCEAAGSSRPQILGHSQRSHLAGLATRLVARHLQRGGPKEALTKRPTEGETCKESHQMRIRDKTDQREHLQRKPSRGGTSVCAPRLARVARVSSFQAEGAAFMCGSSALAAKRYSAAVSSRCMLLHRQWRPCSASTPLTARAPPPGAAISSRLTTVCRPVPQKDAPCPGFGVENSGFRPKTPHHCLQTCAAGQLKEAKAPQPTMKALNPCSFHKIQLNRYCSSSGAPVNP